MRRARGFTIIELMMVVTIIGIIAAIAIPVYQNYLTTAKVAEAAALADPVKLKVTEYVMSNGAFPADNATVNLEAPLELGGKYVRSVEIRTEGVVVVTFGDPVLTGQTITLTPTAAETRVDWRCSTTLPPNLRPKYCA